MKLGVIARSDNRGLANQTYEVCRALRPDRVLLVDMGDDRFPSHHERYTDLGLNVTIIPVGEMGEWHTVRPWLTGLDVVYTAETFYADTRFCQFARAENVRTVCHLNPEFYKHGHEPDWPKPDEWWLPSPWMQGDSRLPVDAYLVPMPVPDRLIRDVGERAPGPLRVLHVTGKPAQGDRNGLRNLFQGIRKITVPCEINVRAQAVSLPNPGDLPRGVKYRPLLADIADYSTMYAGFDVFVMPRRYGGLCLPVIEAAGSGLGVVMTDCDPNWFYPARLVEATNTENVATPLGPVPAYDTIPTALGSTLSAIASDDGLRDRLKEMARTWAESMSWEQQAPIWRMRLQAVRSR